MKFSISFKIIAVMAILTVAIVLAGTAAQRILGTDAEKLSALIVELEKNVAMENWKQAGILSDKINAEWSAVKGKWSALVDHEEIDNIDVSVSRLQMSVRTVDKPSSLSEASALEKYIGHIPEKELPVIRNIF